MISFIIFNTEKIADIKNVICGLFGIGNFVLVSEESLYYLSSYLGIFIIAFISATPAVSIFCRKNILLKKENSQEKQRFISKMLNILEPVFLLFVFVISTSYIIDGSFNPFLYFRF